jgi:ApaG protein
MAKPELATPEFTSKAVVKPLPEQSDPAQGQHAFSYTITIRNTGNVGAQLIARHWVITDANGHVEEVRGLAVVGNQPLLRPGESFEYTSWTRLSTPQGTMRGTFLCVTEDARPFDAPVHEFTLALPSSLH